MNPIFTVGIILCSLYAATLLVVLYVKWLSYVLDRFEDSVCAWACLCTLPFAIIGAVLMVIGLLV